MKIRLLLLALLTAFATVPAHGQTTTTYTQTGPFQLPAGAPGVTQGPASVYPINFTVAGITSPVTGVTFSLNGLSHTWPNDLDILLTGPTGANVMLMSDVGGFNPGVTNINLVFDQNATASLGTTATSGTYLPSDSDPASDTMAAPAPAGPYGNTLSVFNGLDPNGTWSLFIMDDSNGDVGSLQSATLSITATPEPATWAMMISGFGFVGGALRRRRRAETVAAIA